jgi:ABC-type uncharacterized transport system permease subunit
MPLIAHVTSYEFGTGIAVFLAGVVVGQAISLIAGWLRARRG